MKYLKYIIVLILLFSFNAFAGTAYYADLNDGGSNQGTFANPFNSLSTINGYSFSTGDDLYFKQNTTQDFTASLSIDWTGTSGDTVIIGCYEAEGDFDCSGTRPIIDGNNTYPSGGLYSGLISSTKVGLEYVVIQDLQIVNSASGGVRFDPATGGVNHITVDNCYIDTTIAPAIILIHASNSSITNNATIDGGMYSVNPWQPSISINCDFDDGLCEDNTISGNYLTGGRGEGIGLYKSVGNTIVEKNVLWNVWSYNLYNGAASHDNTFRYNLCYHTADTPHRSVAMAVGCEYWTCATPGSYVLDPASSGVCSDNTKFYGNMIAGATNAFQIDTSLSCSNAGLKASGTELYNNTLVDSTSYNLHFLRPGPGTVIKNNISLIKTSGGSHTDGCTDTNITWDTNLFYGGTLPGGGSDRCETNEVNVDPALSGSSWMNLTGGAVTGVEFQLTGGTPYSVSHGGLDLGTSLEYTLIPDSCDFTATPITCTEADADDYAWPIGAFLGRVPSISGAYPSSLQDCPDDGVFGFTSSSSANCKYSVKGSDTCNTAYADLDTAMTTGQGTLAHEEDVGTPSCGTSTTYVAKCEDIETGLESNCLEIIIAVAAEGGANPQSSPVTLLPSSIGPFLMAAATGISINAASPIAAETCTTGTDGSIWAPQDQSGGGTAASTIRCQKVTLATNKTITTYPMKVCDNNSNTGSFDAYLLYHNSETNKPNYDSGAISGALKNTDASALDDCGSPAVYEVVLDIALGVQTGTYWLCIQEVGGSDIVAEKDATSGTGTDRLCYSNDGGNNFTCLDDQAYNYEIYGCE